MFLVHCRMPALLLGACAFRGVGWPQTRSGFCEFLVTTARPNAVVGTGDRDRGHLRATARPWTEHVDLRPGRVPVPRGPDYFFGLAGWEVSETVRGLVAPHRHARIGNAPREPFATGGVSRQSSGAKHLLGRSRHGRRVGTATKAVDPSGSGARKSPAAGDAGAKRAQNGV